MLLPIILALVLGMVEFSMILAIDQQLAVASREGARVGSQGGSASEVEAAAQLILGTGSDLTRLPWVNHRSRRWEAEPLRWLGVNAGLHTMSWADQRESRTGHQSRAAQVFGLSSQSNDYQTEMASRLHLPFPVLSDERLELTRALKLPTMEVAGLTLIKRLALVIDDAHIRHVFYPVFPPDRNAGDVLEWLRDNPVKS